MTKPVEYLTYWDGQNVEDMSREELIAAMKMAAGIMDRQREELSRLRASHVDFVVRASKRLREVGA